MLRPEIIVRFNDAYTKMFVYDVTGAYAPTTNPYGYGIPNESKSLITAATIKIEMIGYSEEVFTETISFSAPDFEDVDLFQSGGYEIDITSLISSLTKYPDAMYEITYTLTGTSGNTYTYVLNEGVYDTVSNCVRAIALKLPIPIVNYKEMNDYYYAIALLQTIEACLCSSNISVFDKALKELEKVCQGCGMSGILPLPSLTSNGGCC